MDKKHIGFIFNYDENWVGGSYYIINIIQALKTIPDTEQPKVSILSTKRDDFLIIKNETNYKNLKFFPFPKVPSLINRIVNKLVRRLIGKDSFLVKTKLTGIDFVYPNYSDLILNSSIPKVYWIPDFQEVFLPHFFSKKQLLWRKENQKYIVENAKLVVLSSLNALNHFKRMYPEYKERTMVLPFAVTHPSLNELDFSELQKKFELPEKYLFSPNQFWVHKNHITVLKAIKILKDKGENISVVFSGKEYDYRSPNYFNTLKKYVEENNLSENVRFLGFIDRTDQLMILKNSLAVIQPSLFEGWSTVVEDAKAQNKLLILSNIDVHKEQMEGRSALFFDTEDETALADLLIDVWLNKPVIVGADYKIDINKFAESFMNLVDTTLKSTS